jgi:tungstate transport system substrate-binding protein
MAGWSRDTSPRRTSRSVNRARCCGFDTYTTVRQRLSGPSARPRCTGTIVIVTMRLVLLLSVIFALGCGKAPSYLRMATTTSVDNSGLLQAILPSFRQDTGIEVQVLAVGSGRAVELLRRGDADMALTHDPVIEAALLKERPLAAYRKIMFNDFVVVGPEHDEAGVREAMDVADAMRRIAMSTAVFVSRGDESGTHAREQQLWLKAGAKPTADRLL